MKETRDAKTEKSFSREGWRKERRRKQDESRPVRKEEQIRSEKKEESQLERTEERHGDKRA